MPGPSTFVLPTVLFIFVEMRSATRRLSASILSRASASFPEVVDWKTGNYKLLKRWKPVYSRSHSV